MIRKTLLAVALLASFTGGVYHRELAAQPAISHSLRMEQPVEATAAKFLATVAAAREAETERPAIQTALAGRPAPIFDKPKTIPIGGLCMIPLTGVELDKLDYVITGGEYQWNGKEVVLVPKQPEGMVIPNALTNQLILLLGTQEEYRGTYSVVIIGGDALRVIPLTIGTGTGPAPVVVVPPGPVPPGPIPPGPDPPPVVVPSKATHAVYVYEKDQHVSTPGVRAGLNRLNREFGIEAVELDVDVTTGHGKIPEKYKLPFSTAKESGLPALVVMGGGKVIRVVKDPKTEAQVMEAVK